MNRDCDLDDTLRKIKIMQSFIEGMQIESKIKDSNTSSWLLDKNPLWDWSSFDYRIKEEICNYNYNLPLYRKMVECAFEYGLPIEYRTKNCQSDNPSWELILRPTWLWDSYDYRTKPTEKEKNESIQLSSLESLAYEFARLVENTDRLKRTDWQGKSAQLLGKLSSLDNSLGYNKYKELILKK